MASQDGFWNEDIQLLNGLLRFMSGQRRILPIDFILLMEEDAFKDKALLLERYAG